jgi:KaiC/GvpD/RAD55 family RecA-like ATPase
MTAPEMCAWCDRPLGEHDTGTMHAACASEWLTVQRDGDVQDRVNGIKTAGRAITLTPAAAIRAERIRWFWDQRIPRRSVIVIPGEKGLGKSTLTNAYLPARLSRGELEGEFYGQPIDVVIATAEDDWRSVVRPRLEAHGADLDRVHQITVTDAAGASLFTLPDDVIALEYAISRLEATTSRKVGLLVLDPITAFLSGTIDSHKDAAVRRAIAPLAAFADRADLAVLIVAHLTKDDSARLLNRVTGSGAFVNAARGVLAWARDPEDPDGDQGYRRVLVPVATNWGMLAPTLAAHIDSTHIDSDDGPISVPLLTIDGESTVSVSDLQRSDADSTGLSGPDAVALALTADWRPSLEIKIQIAAELGASHRAIERYAKQLEADGILERDKRGFPAVGHWRLTSVATHLDAPSVATAQVPANADDPGHAEVSSDSLSCLRARDALGVTDINAARLRRLEHYDQVGREALAELLNVDPDAVADMPIEQLSAFPSEALQ